jgi:type VI secretion system protein ImpG
MLNMYYTQELHRLREIAAEFARENPALAPMLEEPSSDPDVERLLEGVAFLTGAVREKLDDEIPEIIHDLMRQIWPQALRPIPSATLISFVPDQKISQKLRIASGVHVDSRPVQGTACRFRTCSAVDLHPLTLTHVVYEESGGRHPLIRLSFSMNSGTVARYKPEKLCLHLGGIYHDAAGLYHHLTRDLKEIRLHAEGDEAPFCLGPECLNPLGFSADEALIPWPSNSFDGYRLLQEYFLMPEKFLFVEIKGLDRWTSRSDAKGFDLEFMMNRPCDKTSKPTLKNFVMATTPAVNLFAHPAVPVLVDHRKTDYPVRPGGKDSGAYQVYSIEGISGFVRGAGMTIDFMPFHSFSAGQSEYVYHENLKKNPVRETMDVSVSLTYPPDKGIPDLKNLSFDIMCTNGFLPEILGEGDICVTTANTPEAVRFRNTRKPTVASLPPLGTDILWKLVSLMTVNHLSLSHPKNLKALLRLFVPETHRDRQTRTINQRKIEGILDISAEPANRLVCGLMVQGMNVEITVRQSHFAGRGDVTLFGAVLDRFLGMYAPINTFTRLTITDYDSGEIWIWPERMGDQPLM